jgi:hypothetical protein
MLKLLFVLACAGILADATQTFPREHAPSPYLSSSDRGIAELRPLRRDGPLLNVSLGSLETGSLATTISSSLLPTVPSQSVLITTPIPTTNHTSLQNTSTITSQESCSGSVTYLNSVPPTLYLTITTPFNVTVSASNATLPPATLITPLVACVATVIPQAVSESEAPQLASASVPCLVCLPGVTATALASSTPLATASFQLPPTIISAAAPQATTNPHGPQFQSTEEEPTGSAFTSTVFVTKKTPVPVVASSSSAPPVFQIPSTKSPATTTSSHVAGGGGGGSTTPIPTSKAPSAKAGTSKALATNFVVSQPPTTTSIGNIIASIINSPFTPVGSSSTKVDNVPVQVLSSSVVIGGQALSIPSGTSKTTVVVNGQTFTVQNSEIIASGTTYAITPARNQVSATASVSAVTVEGLTFSVGASKAVISGTTYAIGSGAGSSETIKVGSETLIIGSGGVILPSTTVAPVKITAAPLAPETITAAGLTFIVGQSSAVISGTTYAIGAGAKSTTIVVGGKTISIGSNGIGLASTTLAPEPNFSVIIVDGLTFSVDSSEAVIGGTTYHIGKGASPTTEVVDGKTISLGPGGVGLKGTTIPPETGAAPTSTAGSYTGAAASCSFNHWSALSALIAGIGAMACF